MGDMCMPAGPKLVHVRQIARGGTMSQDQQHIPALRCKFKDGFRLAVAAEGEGE